MITGYEGKATEMSWLTKLRMLILYIILNTILNIFFFFFLTFLPLTSQQSCLSMKAIHVPWVTEGVLSIYRE